MGVEVEASSRSSRVDNNDLHLHAVFRPVSFRALERVVVLNPAVKEDLGLARAYRLCEGDGNLEGWASQRLPRCDHEGASRGVPVFDIGVVKVFGETLRLADQTDRHPHIVGNGSAAVLYNRSKCEGADLPIGIQNIVGRVTVYGDDRPINLVRVDGRGGENVLAQLQRKSEDETGNAPDAVPSSRSLVADGQRVEKEAAQQQRPEYRQPVEEKAHLVPLERLMRVSLAGFLAGAALGLFCGFWLGYRARERHHLEGVM
jgi:hypothetical protein